MLIAVWLTAVVLEFVCFLLCMCLIRVLVCACACGWVCLILYVININVNIIRDAHSSNNADFVVRSLVGVDHPVDDDSTQQFRLSVGLEFDAGLSLTLNCFSSFSLMFLIEVTTLEQKLFVDLEFVCGVDA